MPQIKLLATDYDDTLVRREGVMGPLTNFKEAMNKLKATSETQWAIVTGRDFHSLHLILKQFRSRGLKPDFILVSESYIFRWTKIGYFPDLVWNLKVWWKRRRVRKEIAKHIDFWEKEILSRWPTCRALSSRYASLWYHFSNKEEAIAAEQFLDAEISDLPKLQTFRSGAEVYMGVTYCGKGDALNELCRKYKIDLAETLAVGDGDNDLSMLDGSSAKMIACVENSCSKLKEVVKQAEGYQAENSGVDGVVESINYFLER
ncbi:MAG: HAD family phosphatase [Lentisphaeria bacterium]|nr:HAD family phosphatase [Lentisphaeria bacterium]